MSSMQPPFDFTNKAAAESPTPSERIQMAKAGIEAVLQQTRCVISPQYNFNNITGGVITIKVMPKEQIEAAQAAVKEALFPPPTMTPPGDDGGPHVH